DSRSEIQAFTSIIGTFFMLWNLHLDLLRKALLAQFERIRASSSHSAIKGTSIEAALRRLLQDYLPRQFSVGTGQIANVNSMLSPQLDILIYDEVTFPRLAVNEDGSVVICAEALYG